MAKTKIEWTEKTWNPVTGCTKISAGCKNCYAEAMANRLKNIAGSGYENVFKVTLHPERLNQSFGKKPSMIFVCSMSDLFHKDVPFDFIENVFEVIRANPQHIFQVLTKRAERLAEYFDFWHRGVPDNAWLGVTVENKKDGLPRIECLKKINVGIRFLSCEPLLNDLGELNLTGIDWVIVGGESGKNAIPTNPDWVRNIQRQCEEQNVSFFFKQWGEFIPFESTGQPPFFKSQNGIEIDAHLFPDFETNPKNWLVDDDCQVVYKRVGKKAAGHLLDGVEYRAMPEGL